MLSKTRGSEKRCFYFDPWNLLVTEGSHAVAASHIVDRSAPFKVQTTRMSSPSLRNNMVIGLQAPMRRKNSRNWTARITDRTLRKRVKTSTTGIIRVEGTALVVCTGTLPVGLQKIQGNCGSITNTANQGGNIILGAIPSFCMSDDFPTCASYIATDDLWGDTLE